MVITPENQDNENAVPITTESDEHFYQNFQAFPNDFDSDKNSVISRSSPDFPGSNNNQIAFPSLDRRNISLNSLSSSDSSDRDSTFEGKIDPISLSGRSQIAISRSALNLFNSLEKDDFETEYDNPKQFIIPTPLNHYSSNEDLINSSAVLSNTGERSRTRSTAAAAAAAFNFSRLSSKQVSPNTEIYVPENTSSRSLEKKVTSPNNLSMQPDLSLTNSQRKLPVAQIQNLSSTASLKEAPKRGRSLTTQSMELFSSSVPDDDPSLAFVMQLSRDRYINKTSTINSQPSPSSSVVSSPQLSTKSLSQLSSKHLSVSSIPLKSSEQDTPLMRRSVSESEYTLPPRRLSLSNSKRSRPVSHLFDSVSTLFREKSLRNATPSNPSPRASPIPQSLEIPQIQITNASPTEIKYVIPSPSSLTSPEVPDPFISSQATLQRSAKAKEYLTRRYTHIYNVTPTQALPRSGMRSKPTKYTRYNPLLLIRRRAQTWQRETGATLPGEEILRHKNIRFLWAVGIAELEAAELEMRSDQEKLVATDTQKTFATVESESIGHETSIASQGIRSALLDRLLKASIGTDVLATDALEDVTEESESTEEVRGDKIELPRSKSALGIGSWMKGRLGERDEVKNAEDRKRRESLGTESPAKTVDLTRRKNSHVSTDDFDQSGSEKHDSPLLKVWDHIELNEDKTDIIEDRQAKKKDRGLLVIHLSPRNYTYFKILQQNPFRNQKTHSKSLKLKLTPIKKVSTSSLQFESPEGHNETRTRRVSDIGISPVSTDQSIVIKESTGTRGTHSSTENEIIRENEISFGNSEEIEESKPFIVDGVVINNEEFGDLLEKLLKKVAEIDISSTELESKLQSLMEKQWTAVFQDYESNESEFFNPVQKQLSEQIVDLQYDTEEMEEKCKTISKIHTRIDETVRDMVKQVDNFTESMSLHLGSQLKLVEDGVEQIESMLLRDNLGLIGGRIGTEVYYQALEYLLAFLGFSIWSWFQVYKLGRGAAESTRKAINWVSHSLTKQTEERHMIENGVKTSESEPRLENLNETENFN
ncbi:hypothetical protein HK096_002831 [Nowakowskiella sp. JEL0078]|nr:hypothetical protein HK096_002831 [Nowakowskiella sp. JEL0078]